MLAEPPDAPEGDPDADAHDLHNFSFLTAGRLPNPLPALAGAGVTDMSRCTWLACCAIPSSPPPYGPKTSGLKNNRGLFQNKRERENNGSSLYVLT